ncbi:MAG: DUF4199 domain-containing protein [Cytophagales bacterium]|nr:DUF4199 domain-containing protein [Cytophagales bacterium]
MEENTQPAVTTRSVGLRYGVILAAISIVYFTVLTVMNVDMTQGAARWASIVFYVAVIYLAQKNFLSNGDGFMGYGQGMGVVFWIGLVSSTIYSIFFYVYIKFIDSGFAETIKDKQIEEMQNRGMSDGQIDQAMDMASKFMSPEALLIFGFLGGIIFVVITGLIVTIFTQKANQQASL